MLRSLTVPCRHRMLGDLLIGLLEVTEDSLARRPLEPRDEEAAHLALIEPMYPVQIVHGPCL